MGTTVTVKQRTRENAIVKSYTFVMGIANGNYTGLTYDGHYLWASCSGTINAAGAIAQFDLESQSVIYEFNVTGLGATKHDVIDLAFDGEAMRIIEVGGGAERSWLLDRVPGAVAMPLRSLATTTNGNSTGICFDGEYYWITRVPITTTIEQWARDSSGGLVLVKNVNPGSAYGGIVFDGEFLITHPRVAGLGNYHLVYVDRSTGAVVKQNNGEPFTANSQNGMAFDGEFIYSLESVTVP